MTEESALKLAAPSFGPRLQPLWAPALLLLALLLALLALNRGHLSYSLDDAYTHLAMAEEIGRGNYGVQPGESAAAASSIAWPFLLALFGGALWAPLLLNLILALLCVDLALAWLRELWPDASSLALTILALAVLLAGNLAGLVFTGMEHLLQVACGLWILRGLDLYLRRGRISCFWQAVLVLAPLVRYELLALTIPALLLLGLRQRPGRALLLLLLALAPLAAYSLWLVHLGLDPLPASILVKSGARPGLGVLELLLRNGLRNLLDAQGLLLGLASVMAFAAWRNTRRTGPERDLALFALAAALLHLGAGHLGWYARYEQYVWLPVLLILARLHAAPLQELLRRRSSALALLVAFVLIHRLNLHAVLTSPLAANNILQQQGEMRHFAAEIWQGPVAVNDIGFVNYQNEQAVLDLWGLSSPEARAWRAGGMDAAGLDRLVRERGIALVMIYEDWFPHIPPGWRRLGDLRLTRPCVTPARPDVSFWCADSGAWDSLRQVGLEFRAGLPEGVLFYLMDEGLEP